MEEINKLTEREELKTYFETGKYPTQSQFEELIDSLRHKEDTLGYKDIVNIANRLEALDSRIIEYSIYGTGDLKFPIIISQNDAEDLVIELKDTNGPTKTQKIFGNGPFIITAKEFPVEILETHEYYVLYYNSYDEKEGSSELQRLFGNNLPTIPDGLEIGIIKGKQTNFGVFRQDLGQEVHILHSDIQFVNKTGVNIQYKAHSGYWSSIYTNKGMITDHYNLADHLNFIFSADLQEIDRNIECRVYNEENSQFLTTASLLSGQNNMGIWANGEVKEIRNIRIECDYQ